MGALNGVLMRGAFQGVATDAYGSEIHVAYEAVDREGQITERVERIQFRAFNPATGVASEVAKSLVDLPIGTRIAIKLFTDIKPAGIKKDGRPYKPFATYAALALEIEE